MIGESADLAGQAGAPGANGFGRVRTGNPQADEILGGGFPANSINIVMGQPGTGKTIFAEQLIFANADGDRPVVFLTTLSEPLSKVVLYLQDLAFYDASKLGTEVIYEDIGPELVEGGLSALVPRLKAAIKTHTPKIIVIDSFKAVTELAPSRVALRRAVFELTGLLSALDTTVFLVGEYSEEDISHAPEFAIADSIVELSRRSTGAREERYFRVFKLRGSQYREGAHGFRISATGLDVFPRLVSPALPASFEPPLERVSTGVAQLDLMMGGGLWRGSTTLLAGPSGSGKTTLALQFAVEGALQHEPSLYFTFQETPAQLERAIRGHSMNLPVARINGLELAYSSPVELQIDSIITDLFTRLERTNTRRLVLDAVGDLATSASDRQRFHDYLYALVHHLAARGITSIFAYETEAGGRSGRGFDAGPLSYLSDNLLQLGMAGDEVTRRTIRVLKTRGSAHDHNVREMEITSGGVRIR